MRKHDTPMSTVGGRPTKVLHTLNSSTDVLVQCRLADGEDVHIPLSTLFALFDKDGLADRVERTGHE